MSESELEAELRALKPARPSLNLEMAIARELEAELRALMVLPAAGVIVRRREGRSSVWRSLGWAFGGAVAAALALIAFLPLHVAPSKIQLATNAVEPAYFEPLESVRNVIASEQSEIIYDGDDGPAQVVRTSSVERHTWTNPTTGAVVELEVPREDLVLVSLNYQ